MKSDMIIVDVQGFKDTHNNFIIKEFALATSELTQTFLIKPPYPYKSLTKDEIKHVKWVEFHLGLRWSEGYIDYREFKRIIIPYLTNKKVLAKGLEKVKWIKELCDNCNVIDLGEKGCPNLSNLYNIYGERNNIYCVHHSKICALKNVLCIKKWYIDNNIIVFNLFN